MSYNGQSIYARFLLVVNCTYCAYTRTSPAASNLTNAAAAPKALGSFESDKRAKYAAIALDCLFVPVGLETFGRLLPGATPRALCRSLHFQTEGVVRPSPPSDSRDPEG